MNSEQRKAMQSDLDAKLGYSLEEHGAHVTIRDVMPGVMQTWLLLAILERLESIAESLDAIAARGE